jgi:hypothetical protein
MQTLGLSESTPRTESRLKSLFWPSIQSGVDVDYLGTQGYWICTFIAILSLVVLAATGHAVIGAMVFLLFFVGGMGVREKSRFAAVIVFVWYTLDMFLSGIGIVRILLCALLLSNLRATWIASGWRPDSEEAAAPPRLGDTWADKFADRLPAILWPKVRYPYYVFSVCLLAAMELGVVILLFSRLGLTR